MITNRNQKIRRKNSKYKRQKFNIYHATKPAKLKKKLILHYLHYVVIMAMCCRVISAFYVLQF